MVTDRIKIRDKYGSLKKSIKWFLIILVIVLILIIVYLVGMTRGGKVEIILENPIAGIVLKYTNEAGLIDKEAVVEEAVFEFDEDYINYILAALGTGYLHKSPLFENPLIELDLQGEIWNSEIIKGMPNSQKESIENEDIRISITKEEAVKALLSDNIVQFMKDSYSNGNLGIDMIASKAELFSKGYLEMYKELTGEEISIDDVE